MDKLNGKYAREKGHRLERQVVNDLKSKFPFAKTARLASTLTDWCDIDITGIPFNIQCKAGYEKVNFNYFKLKESVEENLKKNFPPKDEIHKKPYIVIHKISSKKNVVMMDYATFLNILYGKVE